MIFDRSAPFQERSQAFYELTLGKKAAREQARKTLLQIEHDPAETVAIRHTALCRLSGLFSSRSTYLLLPLLLDTNAPWELRAEAAHVLGMAEDPAFLNPAWEQETQYFRAKGRRIFPRS